MRKLSFNVIAMLTVIFAVASASTTAQQKIITMYTAYLVTNQPPGGSENDAEWYVGQSFDVIASQEEEFSQGQLEELFGIYCFPSQEVCYAVTCTRDDILQVMPTIVFGTRIM
jgi:hypothetical protein